MILTSHVLAGAAAGKAVGNPWAAVLLGILLHYILDAIPHVDAGLLAKNKKLKYAIASIDVIISFALLLYAFNFKQQFNNGAILFGGIGAIIPDALDNLPYFSDRLHKISFFNKIYLFHEKIQYFSKKERVNIPLGITTQIIIILMSIYILFWR